MQQMLDFTIIKTIMDYLSVGHGLVEKAISTLHLEREEFYCLDKVWKSNIKKLWTELVCGANLFPAEHKNTNNRESDVPEYILTHTYIMKATCLQHKWIPWPYFEGYNII